MWMPLALAFGAPHAVSASATPATVVDGSQRFHDLLVSIGRELAVDHSFVDELELRAHQAFPEGTRLRVRSALECLDVGLRVGELGFELGHSSPELLGFFAVRHPTSGQRSPTFAHSAVRRRISSRIMVSASWGTTSHTTFSTTSRESARTPSI